MMQHLLALLLSLVSAEKDSNPYPFGNNPNNAFRMYWNDARNILQDLDQSFNALYIQYHNCVWSECSVDNYDDDGEDRDGDEYWYQYRTQPFCANAAFSLYGVLKGNVVLPWDHCSRGTYINSFFTYGGADTLLEAYADELSGSTILDTYNNNNNNNADDAYQSTHSNAICYAQDDENGNSGDDDAQNGYSTTMGCSADGSQFVAALFKGQVCAGNLFQETIDPMTSYNRVIHRNFNCRQIYSRRRDGAAVREYYQALEEQQYNNNNQDEHRVLLGSSSSSSTTTHQQESMTMTSTVESTLSSLLRGTTNNPHRTLENNDDDTTIATPDIPAWTILSQSWACDVTLYPDGCPDPYRLKRRYDAVLNAAAKGRNGNLARFHYRIARFLRMASVLAVVAGIGLYLSAYWISRKEAYRTNGLCTTFCSDLKDGLVYLGKLLRRCCRALVNVLTGKTRRQRKMTAGASPGSTTRSQKSKSSKKRRSKSGSRKSPKKSSSTKSKDSAAAAGEYFAF